jgi:hypothetical protein
MSMRSLTTDDPTPPAAGGQGEGTVRIAAYLGRRRCQVRKQKRGAYSGESTCERQQVWGQAACAWNRGCHRQKSLCRSLSNTLTRVWSRGREPRGGVHCICCFLTGHLQTPWLIVDSTKFEALPLSTNERSFQHNNFFESRKICSAVPSKLATDKNRQALENVRNERLACRRTRESLFPARLLTRHEAMAYVMGIPHDSLGDLMNRGMFCRHSRVKAPVRHMRQSSPRGDQRIGAWGDRTSGGRLVYCGVPSGPTCR